MLVKTLPRSLIVPLICPLSSLPFPLTLAFSLPFTGKPGGLFLLPCFWGEPWQKWGWRTSGFVVHIWKKHVENFLILLNCIFTRFLIFPSFHLGAIKQIWINRWVYILNESRIGVCLLQPQTPGNVPGIWDLGNLIAKIIELIAFLNQHHLLSLFPYLFHLFIFPSGILAFSRNKLYSICREIIWVVYYRGIISFDT